MKTYTGVTYNRTSGLYEASILDKGQKVFICSRSSEREAVIELDKYILSRGLKNKIQILKSANGR